MSTGAIEYLYAKRKIEPYSVPLPYTKTQNESKTNENNTIKFLDENIGEIFFYLELSKDFLCDIKSTNHKGENR